MGQWLSIPLVLFGIFLAVRAFKIPVKNYKNGQGKIYSFLKSF